MQRGVAYFCAYMLPSSSTDRVKNSSHQGSSVLRRPNVLILLILALALGLRLYKSSVHGLYLDEKFTLVNTAGVRLEGANQHDVFDKPDNPYFTPKEFWKPKPLRDYIDSIIQNDIGNSPSHYALLWAWVQLFGLSDLSIRMPSILFSTAIVGLLFLLVRRYLKSNSLALTVAGLAAVEPFFIAYSHMARNYCMTIFMALLGTWFFLRILDRRAQGQQPIGLYVGYGLSFALATLGHYLAATIFMGHALYLLVFNRNFKTYLGLGLSTVGGALALIVPWFVWGGGKYTLFTLAYQAKLYGGLALTNPYNNGFGIILPATLANVIKKSIPVWSDLFMISNGLSPETLGNLNLLVALALGVVALALVLRFGQGVVVPAWLKIAVPLLLVAGYVVYSLPTARFVVAAALPMMGFCLYQAIARTATDERRFLVLMGLLSFFPTLVLIAFAFRNGPHLWHHAAVFGIFVSLCAGLDGYAGTAGISTTSLVKDSIRGSAAHPGVFHRRSAVPRLRGSGP